ncbi:uncharacterized protein LOC131807387 [Mustela lutreola]|uniref:uncharacterized protein LOC131807387 n=1 Tax=Mustela lutreola TaxID=9666 RepID=UPI00279771BE|nr:uncharacterized protein LOC131807387 [Mustela lutreola]XP_058988654.1 uncharacterized protein LOC131807387 [Mustela lutreola]XP_058988655.1 uncharacterized protein LOC131807387 [Mustela lutreola]XP_058988656.1 uncharacterized protein LOC131807387 [Mustela lutreola]XP_058988657.1 uncharacterized protein LOC131807387 [Mustela lutreola]XP_058988658.1 uncharacterized protein LOC131807387 [Mustela lutreola]XP_058988659.1 uncharacterized protein LOC131807387 [Mustela lutreola]XP_058988660.1 unc
MSPRHVWAAPLLPPWEALGHTCTALREDPRLPPPRVAPSTPTRAGPHNAPWAPTAWGGRGRGGRWHLCPMPAAVPVQGLENLPLAVSSPPEDLPSSTGHQPLLARGSPPLYPLLSAFGSKCSSCVFPSHLLDRELPGGRDSNESSPGFCPGTTGGGGSSRAAGWVGKPGLGAFSQERPSHQENVSSSSLWKSLNKEAGGSMGTVDVTGSSQNPGDKRKDSKYKFTKLKVPSLWLSPGNKGIRSWRDLPGWTAGRKPIMILHHSPPPPWRTPTTRSHVASRITPQGPRKAGSPPDCHRRRRKRGRNPGASKVSGVCPVLVLKTVGWAAGVAQRVEAFAFGSGLGISGSWDRALHRALCLAVRLLPFLSLPASLLMISVK